MKRIILLFLFLSYNLLCLAQTSDVVKSNDYNIDPLIRLAQERLNANNKRIQATEINIPIQIHIVKDKYGSLPNFENINADFLRLNEFFKPINMKFYFCGPFNIIQNADYFSLEGYELNDMVSNYNLPGTIDIFYVGEIDNCNWCGITYLGFSMGDVILIKNACIGSHTLAHEIGHYFGLDHPHNEQWGLELVDGSNCTVAGDKICDTPAEPILSGKVDGNCKYIGTEVDAKNMAYKPNTNNIMSYTRSECANAFTPGQYTVMQTVYENKIKQTLNCATKVDFAVQIENKINRLNRGQTNTVPIYISNYSPVSYSGTLSYVISLVDNVGRETELRNAALTKSWSAFQYDTIRFNIDIPLSAAEGMYTLKVRINPLATVSESNMNNNSSEHRLGVYNASTLLPDLDLSIVQPNPHEAGYQLSYTYKVKNKGTADLKSNYGMITHISKDPIPSGDDIIVGHYYGSILKVGQQDSNVANINLPHNLDMPYYVIMMVDMEGRIQESNEQNNIQVLKISSIAPKADKWKYDLKATSLKPLFDDREDTLELLSSYWWDIGVQNQNPFPWYEYSKYPESDLRFVFAALYLSKDTKLDASDILLGKRDGRLYQDQGKVSVWMEMPNNIEPGNYYLLGEVDPDNYLTESDETNNVFYKSIYLRKGMNPDLIIQGIPVVGSTKIDYGKPVNYSSVLKNQGNGPSRSWDVIYYLSVDPYKNYNDKSIGVSNHYTSVFNANTTYDLKSSFMVDSTEAGEGTYYLISCVRNHSGEEYGENNCVVNPELYHVGKEISKLPLALESQVNSMESEADVDYQLYPNPTSDFAQLSFNGAVASVTITNELGHTYFVSKNINAGINLHISTAQWPSGMYFLSYYSGAKRKSGKLIVVR